MGIYTVNASIKPTFTLFILKERSQFVLGFIVYLNSFVSFKTIRYYLWLVIYYFIHCHHQLHSSDSPNSTYHWHVPRKWMGSAITAITFRYFLTDKERYNLLDCFRIRIIEESRFSFFDVEDPALNQKLCEMMQNIEKHGVWIAKKKRLKSA